MNASSQMITDHEFYCTCCGKKGLPVVRNKSQLRENGHLKKLYCMYCKKEVNHAEVVENSQYDRQVFTDEFRSGNFDSNGNRSIPLNEWKFLYYGIEQQSDEKYEAQKQDVTDIRSGFRK